MNLQTFWRPPGRASSQGEPKKGRAGQMNVARKPSAVENGLWRLPGTLVSQLLVLFNTLRKSWKAFTLGHAVSPPSVRFFFFKTTILISTGLGPHGTPFSSEVLGCQV